MAASGRDVAAERATAAVNDLIEAREGAATLRIFLLQLDDHRAPHAVRVVDGVLDRLSSAMSALEVSGGAAVVGVQSPAAGSGGPVARGHSSRRAPASQRASDTKITDTLDDGHVWRKYGQKDIQNSTHPRSYYRCTHKSDQGCNAKRQVQSSDTDQSKYVVTYYGKHTCRDPSTIPPLVVHAAAGDAPPDHAGNLISFGPISIANNTSAAAASSSQLYLVGGSGAAADQLSTSWCASDDVFSSSAGSFMHMDELIGAVVVGSAPGVTSSTAAGVGSLGGTAARGGGAASFPPSSPNGGLGFVVGSLGSIDGDEDDDLFPMDP
ncbi:hypothetical protein HU200_023535 [Digitaria exilis]|uniref:WRKY domain-containing protein n=1 Tax=Digitaria exilis TaxID=1010633 RepID=A0A835CCX2_9POAL|nr:hypothetical protein HU200_023535 [Digitaria exilis]